MERFLLVLDDFDDVLGAAMHLAPMLLGLFAALGLFALTVFSFLYTPAITVGALGVLLSYVLLERLRRRLLEPLSH
jgi:hypothetical protein